MDSNLESINQELNALSGDLKAFEGQLMPQLDELARTIPEIYSGYASMVHDLVDNTLTLFNTSNRTRYKVAVAAEIGAKAIEAFGEYKAAKEHNRLLQKYMKVKMTYAQANIEKVSLLLPKITRSQSATAKLFNRFAEIEYDLDKLTETSLESVSRIQQKALSIYRTNTYLLELCKYLSSEYKVWLAGKQTSDNDMPDYYLINLYLSEQLYGDDLFEAYSTAADETRRLKGKQVMLLADYQLSMMALGNKLCKINVKEANPMVGKLIEDCGAHQQYTEHTKKFAKHVEDGISTGWSLFGVMVLFGIVLRGLLYFNASEEIFWIVLLLTLGLVIKFYVRSRKSAMENHVNVGLALAKSVDESIEKECGKVDRPDIDYNERNLLKATISGFLK